MAFTKMGDFTFNHIDQPDELNIPADSAKEKFDSRAEELKTALNNAIDLLSSVTDGNSGADNVGATAIDDLTGENVQALLESLKTLVDGKAVIDHNHDADYAAIAHDHDADYAPVDLAGEGRTTETVKGNADDLADLQQEVDGHKAETATHKTSSTIRNETSTSIRVEVVSSSVSETPDAGRIIFDTSQGKFFGGNGTEWV
jgi:hypothetical protein